MDYLAAKTRNFRDDMFDSSLPWQMIDSAAGRVSVIRCVIIYITLPVHPITLQSGISLTFFSRRATSFHMWAKLFELEVLEKKNFPLDGQTAWPLTLKCE